MLGEFVLVRTRDAGVHCGTLQTLIDTVCTLAEARRVWRWRGANTLHELSLRGAAEEWTRISEPVPVIYLSQVIEVLPCSEEARKNLSKSRWSRE
jgi:hypothetical protein